MKEQHESKIDIHDEKVNQNNVQENKSSSRTPGLLIALILVGILLIAAIVLLSVFLSFKKKYKKKSSSGNDDTTTIDDIMEEASLPNLTISGPPYYYTYNDGNHKVTYTTQHLINETTTISGEYYNNSFYGQNAFLVVDGATLTLKDVVIYNNGKGFLEKVRGLQDVTNDLIENYYYGLNSAVVVIGTGKLIIEESFIVSESEISSAVVAIFGGKAEIRSSTIGTIEFLSRAIVSTYSSDIKVIDSYVYTSAQFSEVLASLENSYISVENTQMESSSEWSAILYSNSFASIFNSKGNSLASQICISNNAQNITLSSSNFTCHGDPYLFDEGYSAIIIWSYDPNGELNRDSTLSNFYVNNCYFTVTNSSFYDEVTIFYIINTNANIYLDNLSTKYSGELFLNSSDVEFYGFEAPTTHNFTTNLYVKQSNVTGSIYASNNCTVNIHQNKTNFTKYQNDTNVIINTN